MRLIRVRISILGLMVAVALIAVVLIALREASDLWAGVVLLLVAGSLGYAVLRVVEGPDETRAWWRGFLVFGAGYFAMAFGGWFGDQQDALATSHLLKLLRGVREESVRGNMAFEAKVRESRRELEQELERAKRVARSPNDPSVNRAMDQIVKFDKNLKRIYAQGGLGGVISIRWVIIPIAWKAFSPGDANRKVFDRVGHSLLVILAGLIGGVISRSLHARRDRAEASGYARPPDAQ